MTVREWDPDEWQSHCCELMLARHGSGVHILPDRDSGDGGLEAYVPGDSLAYQCYAPENPFSLPAQTEAQKAKIRTDTKKLIDNPVRTQELIGQGQSIKHWVLLTPAFESKSLIIYANARSVKVREAATGAWCDPEFSIFIHDESLFSVERAQLFDTRRTLLLPMTALDTQARSDSGLEGILRAKLIVDRHLSARPDLLESVVKETLADYFRGSTELARLSRDFPNLLSAVERCVASVFAGLSRDIAAAESRPSLVVASISKKLQGQLEEALPSMSSALTQLLAGYYIASWWLQCPLNFEEPVDA